MIRSSRIGSVVRSLFDRASGRVLADLRTDPYLAYILLLATVLSGFWFWHRIPNFATRDEQERLLDAMVVYGTFLSDPSFESLGEGVSWGRVPFGATLYLFGLAVLPVVVVATISGQLDVILAIQEPSRGFGFYSTWRDTPRWVWTWSLVFVRLFNVAFAVGSVYLTYRIGVVMRDRMTGRLSAVLLTLTFGFLVLAHEGGEDVPAVFFVLLALYLVLRYARTGDRTLFLAGSAFGGLAIAFKLTAAPVVVLIGLAYLLRTWNVGSNWRGALWQPALVAGGALFGLATILLGFPEALVGNLDVVLERVFEGSADRMEQPTGPAAPTWWWFLRNYLNAFGLPLFVAVIIGAFASAVSLLRRRPDFDVTALSLVGLVVYVFMYAGWHDFRTHHLLPTFPLLALLLAATLERFRARWPNVAAPVVVFLLVTAGLYAGIGTVGYASMPRDQAEDWIAENVAEDETMQVYTLVVQDAAVHHRMDVEPVYQSDDGKALASCPEYVQLGYRDFLHLGTDPAVNRNDQHASFVRSLLDGGYEYEIVAEFGPRPTDYVPQRPRPGSLVELLEIGVVPQSPEYADEQELAPDQFTVILERTAECR